MTSAYLLTDHAIAQMDIRRIGRDILDILMCNGDRKVSLSGGCRALSLTRRRLRDLRHRGVAPAQIERAAKVVAVLGPAEDPAEDRPVVVTILRACGNAGGRYKRSRGR